jgi:ubiquinone/menaquinone biosynthesis C-methylase UbiE
MPLNFIHGLKSKARTRSKKENPENLKLGHISKKREIGNKINWSITDSNLDKISFTLKIDLKKTVEKIIRKNPSPVIVDWGCGTAKAIEEIALLEPKIKAYGFSNVFYESWEKLNKTKLIYADGDQFNRYFKKNSVDLIFSHYGLFHQNQHLQNYLTKVLPSLKKGGILIANAPEKMNFEFKKKIIIGENIYLAQIKYLNHPISKDYYPRHIRIVIKRIN